MSQQERFFSSFNRRRFLQYSGSMALGGSLLAACGSTTSSTSGPTLNQWYHQYGEKGTFQAVTRYPQSYTQASVKVSWVPGTGNDYPNKVNAALLGSGAPDVFELGGPTVDQVKNGLVAPLDDIIADVKSELSPALLNTVTINGKVYGMKIVTDTGVLYYRKSLLQKANLQPPTTMDELIAAAKKLTTGDMKGLFIGQDGGVDALTTVAPWAAGADFLVDNKIVFDTDRTAAAYSKVLELNKSGSLLIDSPTYWWAPDSFIQGLCAMQWTGLWAMPQIKAAFGDDFGVVAWPALDAQSKPATFLGGWTEMVSAKSKNLDAAKAYVKWLWIDNKADQTDFNLSYGFHVPPRSSIAAQADKLKTGAAANALKILGDYGHSTPPAWDAAMGAAMSDAFSNILKNGANPTTEVHNAADKCNTELSKILG